MTAKISNEANAVLTNERPDRGIALSNPSISFKNKFLISINIFGFFVNN